MTIAKDARSSEADLEAAIDAALSRAFPHLERAAIQHQISFTIRLGHNSITVDAAADWSLRGRADVLISVRGRPLAVLELKRKNLKLTDADREQGLSYARVVPVPLVVVTNGEAVWMFTATGQTWAPTDASEERVQDLFASASRAAAEDLRKAVQTLLGPESAVWASAIRATTNRAIEDQCGDWRDALRPFVADYVIPRDATQEVLDRLQRGAQAVVVTGAPLSGKSNVIREVATELEHSSEFAVLVIEADSARAGIFQTIANTVDTSFGWPASSAEIRSWLRNLGRVTSRPALVIAVDGMSGERSQLTSDIEELLSGDYGKNVRLILAIDDTNVETLTLTTTRRSQTRLGRRATIVGVPSKLTRNEFQKALKILVTHRVAFMDGCLATPEFRSPWVLRALAADVIGVSDDADPDKLALLPSSLGIRLLHQVRQRFDGDVELWRQYRDLASAVLADIDSSRPPSLALLSVEIFVVRRKAITDHLDQTDVKDLSSRGLLKAGNHADESIFVPRLQELLAVTVANALSKELQDQVERSPDSAAEWIVSRSSKLPLGDVIAALAIVDAATSTGLPIEFVRALINTKPETQPLRPGTRAMASVGGRLLDVEVNGDGSMTVNSRGGILHVIEPDPGEGLGNVLDPGAWLILSYLAAVPFVASANGQIAQVSGLDIALEVASSPIPLVKPGADRDQWIHSVHEFPGIGSVLCYDNGIIEPITVSLFEVLAREGSAAQPWLENAVKRECYPMLARLDVALREVSKLADANLSRWAADARETLIGPTMRRLLRAAYESPGS